MRPVPVPWTLQDEAIAAGPLAYCLVVDADNLDPVEQDLHAGRWQPAPALAWLIGVLRPGDRVLDLGAHIGTFALPAAAAGADVTAVEASPRNAALLRAGREHSGLSTLQIVERAVDAAAGTLTFLDAGPVSTIETASLGTASGDFTFTVDAVTVDSLSPQGFDWAKIDIEGAEDRALAGATQTLRQLKGLVIESNGHALAEHGSSPEALVVRLRSAGFRLYGAERRVVFPLGRRFFQPETNVDYIAVREELPLPAGWSFARERSRSVMAAALLAELDHPVPEHARYARRAAAHAPLAIRARLALRAASRRVHRAR